MGGGRAVGSTGRGSEGCSGQRVPEPGQEPGSYLRTTLGPLCCWLGDSALPGQNSVKLSGCREGEWRFLRVLLKLLCFEVHVGDSKK